MTKESQKAPVLWTAADAAAATNGTTTGDWTASGVSIDTRTLEPGDLFVALKGPKFDGHDYLAAAFAAGAAAAMIHKASEDLPTDKRDRAVPGGFVQFGSESGGCLEHTGHDDQHEDAHEQQNEQPVRECPFDQSGGHQ